MSAAQTALAVLRWAAWAEGPPPAGDLDALEALLQPDSELQLALADGMAMALARLGLAATGAAGAGTESLLLAAALGAAMQPAAMEVLRLIRAPRAAHDLPTLALHHVLVAPAIPHLPMAMGAEMVARSPLTALLLCPPDGEEDAVLAVAEALAVTAGGRRMLAHRLASPVALAPELRWRARVLDTLRLQPAQQAFVIDVYEAAVALHAGAWMQRIRDATRILESAEPSEPALALADATGRWWEPFLAIYRARHDAVRERRYLNDFELYLAGIRLAQATLRLRQGLH